MSFVDFGALPNLTLLDRVDFTPPEKAFRPLEFGALTQRPGLNTKTRRLTIGCPIWSVKEWVGSVYPPKSKPTEFLRHYGEQFNGIELNSTFYQIPSAGTVDQWRAETPA